MLLSNLLMVINKSYGDTRTDSDESIIEDMSEIIRGTLFARSAEVIVKWHVEERSLEGW